MRVFSRRRFLQMAGVSAVAATVPGLTEAEGLRSSGSATSTFKLPVGAVDYHMHIYDDRFPNVPGTALHPLSASIEQYRKVQARLGIRHNVVVTPSTYGADNRCTLDALKRPGSNARGVAVIDTSVTQAQLAGMHVAGMRATRFNLSYPGATTVDMLTPLVSRIGALGWHIELVVQDAKLPILELHLLALPYPLVIDHIAHVPQPGGMQFDAMRTVQRLVDRGNTWITLPGPYTDSKAGAPTYADVEPVARAFIDMAPEQMLWGTDWPHPTEKAYKPDDATLVDTFATWVDRADWQQMILMTNPVKLYGF